MRDRGYIYTLVTITLILILLSLLVFYFQVSKPSFSTTVTSIRTDELHYFIEAVKKDFARAASIAGQRSATYAINSIISNGSSLDGYTYVACPGSTFIYGKTGAPAAIAELMVCGTLDGSSSGGAKYMENNTIIDWTDRVSVFARDIGFVINMSILNLELFPLGSFNFVVLSTFDTKAKDADNITLYKGNVSTYSVIPIFALEDPLYLIETGELNLVPYFTRCNTTLPVTGAVLDDWIDDACYHGQDKTSEAPSFFDRLEGKTNLSLMYQNQSEFIAALFNLPIIADIGLESFANLDEFDNYNVSINVSNTWVDYLYWRNFPGQCNVTGMAKHPDFMIDQAHGIEYNVSGLDCSAMTSTTTTTTTTTVSPP